MRIYHSKISQRARVLKKVIESKKLKEIISNMITPTPKLYLHFVVREKYSESNLSFIIQIMKNEKPSEALYTDANRI